MSETSTQATKDAVKVFANDYEWWVAVNYVKRVSISVKYSKR